MAWSEYRPVVLEQPLTDAYQRLFTTATKEFFDFIKNAGVVVVLGIADKRSPGTIVHVAYEIGYILVFMQLVFSILRYNVRLFHWVRPAWLGLSIDLIISWAVMLATALFVYMAMGQLTVELGKH